MNVNIGEFGHFLPTEQSSAASTLIYLTNGSIVLEEAYNHRQKIFCQNIYFFKNM
jgi:hypothetical protein